MDAFGFHKAKRRRQGRRRVLRKLNSPSLKKKVQYESSASGHFKPKKLLSFLNSVDDDEEENKIVQNVEGTQRPKYVYFKKPAKNNRKRSRGNRLMLAATTGVMNISENKKSTFCSDI